MLSKVGRCENFSNTFTFGNVIATVQRSESVPMCHFVTAFLSMELHARFEDNSVDA